MTNKNAKIKLFLNFQFVRTLSLCHFGICMRYAFILGKDQDLSIAEIGCILGNDLEHQQNQEVVFFEGELPNIPQKFLDRLGGTVEIIEIFGKDIAISQIESVIETYLKKTFSRVTGKCIFGLNIVPEHKKSSALKLLLPRIKNSLRKSGMKANFANRNLTQNVSTVFAAKHGLTLSRTNISIIDEGEGRFSLGYSIALQDFEAYAKRDYGKPFRDPHVGMLPPKLAQMMINLGTSTPTHSTFHIPHTIFDPFCGTGTILMEAMLMGYSVIGSDSGPRMVEGAKKNIEWLRKTFKIPENVSSEIIEANAIKNLPITIVTEPYLGPPLSNFPHENFLKKLIEELKTLYLNFFKNLATWIAADTPIVLIFPYWRKSNAHSVKLSGEISDKLKALGFRKTTFHPLSSASLFYQRSDQIVGREIVRFIYEKN